MGSPDMPPPPHVLDTLAKASRTPDAHGYAGFAGLPELRQAFADYYQRRFAVSLDPETEVLPLIGSKEGIAHLSLAVLNPGDRVLVPDPGYIAYSQGARLARAQVVPMPLTPESSFLPALDVTDARLMWVNYPNNPTGAGIDHQALAKIVAHCQQHDILLVSDNPYADVSFGGHKPASVLEVEGARSIAVEFASLSKTYNMAGWRVGVCVGRADVVQALLKLKSNVDSGMFKAVQHAAVSALRDTSQQWLQARNAEYARRRDLIMAALPKLGLQAQAPVGGLYIWAKVPEGDDLTYARHALERAHVSLVPGRVYGQNGQGYVRISFVQPLNRIEAALQRLIDFV
jgi:LL-diaminopimelate aminotransferase